MSAYRITLPPIGPGGDAIFSTHLGRFPPRAAGANRTRCIILRSNPEDDRDSMIASLEAKFPAQCRQISSPIKNLCQYFDEYDLQLHGSGFIYSVLEHIALKNVCRWRDIFTYVDEWCSLNSTQLPYVDSLQMNAFTEEDHEVYGQEFLSDALWELSRRKMKSEIDGESHLQLLAPLDPAELTSEFLAAYVRSMQDVQTQDTNVMPLNEPGQESHGRVQPEGRQPSWKIQGKTSGSQIPQGPFAGPSFIEPPHFMLESAAMQRHYPMPVGPAIGCPEVPFVTTVPDAYRRSDHNGDPSPYSSNHSGMVFYDGRVAPPAPRAMSQFAHNSAMLHSGPSVRRKNPPMPYSNDARVLERGGVPMRRRSFGHTSGNLSPKSRPNQRMPYQWHETQPFHPRFPLPSIDNSSSYIAEGGPIQNPNYQMPFGADPQTMTLTERKDRFTPIEVDTLGTDMSSTRVDPHRKGREGNNIIPCETTIHLDQQVSSIPTDGHLPPLTIRSNYVQTDYDQRAKKSPSPRLNQNYQRNDTQSRDSPTLRSNVNANSSRFSSQNNIKDQEIAAKLWIGGLRPDLDVKDLSGVLTPWQPFDILDNLKISYSKYDHGYPGYIFVK
ncbi:MAG: hypothetical protein Q9214_003165 [Letrouitia sp. 1 TL-2023]